MDITLSYFVHKPKFKRGRRRKKEKESLMSSVRKQSHCVIGIANIRKVN